MVEQVLLWTPWCWARVKWLRLMIKNIHTSNDIKGYEHPSLPATALPLKGLCMLCPHVPSGSLAPKSASSRPTLGRHCWRSFVASQTLMEKQAGTVGFRGLCEQNPPTPALAVAGVADKYCLAGCSCGSPSGIIPGPAFSCMVFRCGESSIFGLPVLFSDGAWAQIFRFLAFSCHAVGLLVWPRDTSKISQSCWQPTAVLLPPQSGVCFYNILKLFG